MIKRRKNNKRRTALIGDLIRSEEDVISIAEKHGLSPDDMASWISKPENAHTLRGLCRLADAQAQLLMSRYRLMAATRLIEMATSSEKTKEEVSRRACVDVLKMQLPETTASDKSQATAESEATETEIELVIQKIQRAVWSARGEGAFDGDE